MFFHRSALFTLILSLFLISLIEATQVESSGQKNKSDQVNSYVNSGSSDAGVNSSIVDSIIAIIEKLRKNTNCIECREQLEKGLITLLHNGKAEQLFTLTDSAEVQGWSYRKLHRLRGEILVELEDMARAEIELSKALAIKDSSIAQTGEVIVNTDNPCLIYNRALIRSMTGRFTSALQDIEEAIKQDWKKDDGVCDVTAGARAMRAQVFYNLTNPGWSLSYTILKDIENDESGMDSLLGEHLVTYIKGACLENLDNNKKAVETLRPLLDKKQEELGNLHPMLVKITFYSALLDRLFAEEKMDSVLVVASEAEKQMPNVPVVQTTKYDLYWKQGNFLKAVEHKGIIDDKFPQSTSLTYTLQARALAQAGKVTDARKMIDSALHYDTTLIRAHIANAEVYIAEMKFEKAKSAILRARNIDPQDPRIDMSEALLYATQKKQQQAMELIKNAYKKGFNDNDKMVSNFKQFKGIKNSREYNDFLKQLNSGS